MQATGFGLPDVTDPQIDLGAGETGAQLAWAHMLLGDLLDRVSPLLRPRVAFEVGRRIVQPYLQRDDLHWPRPRTFRRCSRRGFRSSRS